jgi:hypothetical protein
MNPWISTQKGRKRLKEQGKVKRELIRQGKEETNKSKLKTQSFKNCSLQKVKKAEERLSTGTLKENLE